MTCRCPMCGAKNAGKAGARSYGVGLVPRDEHNTSFDTGRDRRKERRLRRRRESNNWRNEMTYNESED